jgi:hypothetical protein
MDFLFKTKLLWCFWRGALKKTNAERPRASAEPIQKAPTHLLLFFPPTCFFLIAFRRFSASGVQKHQQIFVEKKGACRKHFTKKRGKFHVAFS